MTKSGLIISSFLSLIISCGNLLAQNNEIQKANNFMQSVSNNGFTSIANPYPFTYKDSVKLYSSPDTNSNVLRTLKFRTQLTIIESGRDQRKIEEYNLVNGKKELKIKYLALDWYKISYPFSGYIKASDVALLLFNNYEKRTDYFMPAIGVFKLLKYDLSKNIFIDSIELPDFYAEKIDIIDHNGWKNVDMLLHAGFVAPYCGGGGEDIFIIEANNKFTKIISCSYQNIEDITDQDDYESTVYIPVKFGSGKILLVNKGDVEHIFNRYSTALNIYPFPKDLTIPKQELIVKVIKEERAILDKNKKPVFDKDGDCKTKITDKTEFYRWNGVSLSLIKTLTKYRAGISNVLIKE